VAGHSRRTKKRWGLGNLKFPSGSSEGKALWQAGALLRRLTGGDAEAGTNEEQKRGTPFLR